MEKNSELAKLPICEKEVLKWNKVTWIERIRISAFRKSGIQEKIEFNDRKIMKTRFFFSVCLHGL